MHETKLTDKMPCRFNEPCPCHRNIIKIIVIHAKWIVGCLGPCLHLRIVLQLLVTLRHFFLTSLSNKDDNSFSHRDAAAHRLLKCNLRLGPGLVESTHAIVPTLGTPETRISLLSRLYISKIVVKRSRFSDVFCVTSIQKGRPASPKGRPPSGLLFRLNAIQFCATSVPHGPPN